MNYCKRRGGGVRKQLIKRKYPLAIDMEILEVSRWEVSVNNWMDEILVTEIQEVPEFNSIQASLPDIFRGFPIN